AEDGIRDDLVTGVQTCALPIYRSRSNDEDSVRGPHQGQQSTRTAPTGRTHDCKRLLCGTLHFLLPGGGHPHMKRREFIALFGGEIGRAWCRDDVLQAVRGADYG